MEKRLIEKKIVPVAVIDEVEDAVPLAQTLSEAGLPLIEVTLRTPCALDAIRAIRANCPNVLVGAGTVLHPTQAADARAAGAQFGVSPGLNEAVVRAARNQGWFFVPGVMTPSEVEAALALGCRLLKFFPAEAAGGLKMLQALAGPYSHYEIQFIPLGGISAANFSAYLDFPIVAAVGGSWLCERKLVREKQWDTIRSLAAEAVVRLS